MRLAHILAYTFEAMGENTYARPTGRLVQRPKKTLEKPAMAAVAVTRSSLTSGLLLSADHNQQGERCLDEPS